MNILSIKNIHKNILSIIKNQNYKENKSIIKNILSIHCHSVLVFYLWNVVIRPNPSFSLIQKTAMPYSWKGTIISQQKMAYLIIIFSLLYLLRRRASRKVIFKKVTQPSGIQFTSLYRFSPTSAYFIICSSY